MINLVLPAEPAASVRPAPFLPSPNLPRSKSAKGGALAALARRIALLLATAALASLPGLAAAQGSCDRACLRQVGETYLAALAAKDIKRLPLAPRVRFTENGSELALGDGLWGTVEGLLDYRFFVVDQTSGNVGIFSAVRESGQRALLGVRIKAPDGRISEIETLVARRDPGSGFKETKELIVRPRLTETLPKDRRVSRAQTIAAADSYFVGLDKATDQGVAFAPDCIRHENGTQLTSNPSLGIDIAKLNCKQQFATGFSEFITGLRDRRWIVDDETGVAMSVLFFDHAGTVKKVALKDGTTMEVPYPFNRPYSFELFEAFKIDGGQIHEVEAILTSVPYGMSSGWKGQP
jgi:hypothetical protein